VTEPIGAAAFEALLGRRSDHLLVIVDESLRIVRAGSEAAALADRATAELVGMSLIAAFGSASLDAVARQALSADGASGEAALGHLGARQFAIDAIPLKSGGLVLSMHEITQLKRIERVRRDFVANIGHELRTPLTSIKLLAESLSSGAVDDLETMREFAGQVERETDHLAQLVDELLDLTMIESGETTLTTAAIDPDGVVRDLVTRIGPVAERRDVRVQMLPSPAEQVQAVADPERLGQALLNLAHNAVKYSHPGGEVRLGWEIGDAQRIRFTVADDGIGVPEIHQPRIFERFYKVDRARTREPGSPMGGSAGLGLSIVRHIAEAHGGTVGMTSDEGVGSTFWIEVPSAAA
jgi:two-component system, OmpR family, phosphate regulon sensor histidine kinase PhoR